MNHTAEKTSELDRLGFVRLMVYQADRMIVRAEDRKIEPIIGFDRELGSYARMATFRG
jgi:hypothetical protein